MASEDTDAKVVPIVKLQESPVTTGKEDKDALDLAFHTLETESKQWKEGGVGAVKLLENKEMENKRLKLCDNDNGNNQEDKTEAKQKLASTSTTEPTTLKEDESMPPAEDEDTGTQDAPTDVLIFLKARFYSFDTERKQWKERGNGFVMLLKNKKRVWFAMRQRETLELCAYHYVCPTTRVREHLFHKNCCVSHVVDFEDGELKNKFFCICFTTVENCKSFIDKIQEIIDSMAKGRDQSEEGHTAAACIEQLSVEGNTKEDKTEANEKPASTSTTKPTTLKEEDESKPPAEGKDIGAHVAPIVKLEEVPVTTEEENDYVLLDLKGILYTLHTEGLCKKWKEIGAGAVKLLKNKKTYEVRLVMRQKETLKLCASYNVIPEMVVRQHRQDDKSCLLHFWDGLPETLNIRFASVMDCKYFQHKLECVIEYLPLVREVVQRMEKLAAERKAQEKTEPASSEEMETPTDEKDDLLLS